MKLTSVMQDNSKLEIKKINTKFNSIQNSTSSDLEELLEDYETDALEDVG